MSDAQIYRNLLGATLCDATIVIMHDDDITEAGSKFEIAAYNRSSMGDPAPNVPVAIRIDNQNFTGRIHRVVHDDEGEICQILVAIHRGGNVTWLVIIDLPGANELWKAQQFYLVIPAGKKLRPLWV